MVTTRTKTSAVARPLFLAVIIGLISFAVTVPFQVLFGVGQHPEAPKLIELMPTILIPSAGMAISGLGRNLIKSKSWQTLLYIIFWLSIAAFILHVLFYLILGPMIGLVIDMLVNAH
jgi:hypothetical protein